MTDPIMFPKMEMHMQQSETNTPALTSQCGGLTHLHISHYALIERLDIDWENGFSVITGETGAGKSIILGALGLLLGARADAKAIQPDEKKCCVEGIFNISQNGLEPFFAANDIDYDPKECILRREVTQTGKSRAFINDSPVSAAKLKELASLLIDIHSQHQNLLIRHENFLINTLDILAQQPNLLQAYKCLYGQCRHAQEILHQLLKMKSQGTADKEYMEFQLQQIDEAALTDGEQEELEQEQQILSHSEEIKQAYFNALNAFNNDEVQLCSNLRKASGCLAAVSEQIKEAGELAERISSACIELEDVMGEMEHQADNIEYDPQRLEFIENRLNTIYELEQKHHVNTISELLAIGQDFRSRIDAICNVDDDIAKQQAEVERLTLLRDKQAAQLTASRQKAAKTMREELAQSLQSLGMPHVQIEVKITPRTEPDASGADNVMFLFTANKNMPLQDISQIASGGEIARVMLSLKAIIAKRTHLPTIIFDEIDTGVSGTIADRMAQMMKQISATCQVICITHLPQIAAFGSQHYKVYKEDTTTGTHSHIVRITPDERVTEIAHMLSGAEITDAAISNAKALLGSK